jgi:hypothetical protein
MAKSQVQEEIAVQIAHEMVQSGIMKFKSQTDIERMMCV